MYAQHGSASICWLAVTLGLWLGSATASAAETLRWTADGAKFHLKTPSGWTVAAETGRSIKLIRGLDMTILANLKEPLRGVADDYTESLTLARLDGSEYQQALGDKSLRQIIEILGPAMGWGANIYAPSSLAKPKWIELNGVKFCRFDQHSNFSHGPAQARYYVCKSDRALYWFATWSRPADALRHQSQCEPLIRELLKQIPINPKEVKK